VGPTRAERKKKDEAKGKDEKKKVSSFVSSPLLSTASSSSSRANRFRLPFFRSPNPPSAHATFRLSSARKRAIHSSSPPSWAASPPPSSRDSRLHISACCREPLRQVCAPLRAGASRFSFSPSSPRVRSGRGEVETAARSSSSHSMGSRAARPTPAPSFASRLSPPSRPAGGTGKALGSLGATATEVTMKGGPMASDSPFMVASSAVSLLSPRAMAVLLQSGEEEPSRPSSERRRSSTGSASRRHGSCPHCGGCRRRRGSASLQGMANPSHDSHDHRHSENTDRTIPPRSTSSPIPSHDRTSPKPYEKHRPPRCRHCVPSDGEKEAAPRPPPVSVLHAMSVSSFPLSRLHSSGVGSGKGNDKDRSSEKSSFSHASSRSYSPMLEEQTKGKEDGMHLQAKKAERELRNEKKLHHSPLRVLRCTPLLVRHRSATTSPPSSLRVSSSFSSHSNGEKKVVKEGQAKKKRSGRVPSSDPIDHVGKEAIPDDGGIGKMHSRVVQHQRSSSGGGDGKRRTRKESSDRSSCGDEGGRERRRQGNPKDNAVKTSRLEKEPKKTVIDVVTVHKVKRKPSSISRSRSAGSAGGSGRTSRRGTARRFEVEAQEREAKSSVQSERTTRSKLESIVNPSGAVEVRTPGFPPPPPGASEIEKGRRIRSVSKERVSLSSRGSSTANGRRPSHSVEATIDVSSSYRKARGEKRKRQSLDSMLSSIRHRSGTPPLPCHPPSRTENKRKEMETTRSSEDHTASFMLLDSLRVERRRGSGRCGSLLLSHHLSSVSFPCFSTSSLSCTSLGCTTTDVGGGEGEENEKDLSDERRKGRTKRRLSILPTTTTTTVTTTRNAWVSGVAGDPPSVALFGKAAEEHAEALPSFPSPSSSTRKNPPPGTTSVLVSSTTSSPAPLATGVPGERPSAPTSSVGPPPARLSSSSSSFSFSFRLSEKGAMAKRSTCRHTHRDREGEDEGRGGRSPHQDAGLAPSREARFPSPALTSSPPSSVTSSRLSFSGSSGGSRSGPHRASDVVAPTATAVPYQQEAARQRLSGAPPAEGRDNPPRCSPSLEKRSTRRMGDDVRRTRSGCSPGRGRCRGRHTGDTSGETAGMANSRPPMEDGAESIPMEGSGGPRSDRHPSPPWQEEKQKAACRRGVGREKENKGRREGEERPEARRGPALEQRKKDDKKGPSLPSSSIELVLPSMSSTASLSSLPPPPLWMRQTSGHQISFPKKTATFDVLSSPGRRERIRHPAGAPLPSLSATSLDPLRSLFPTHSSGYHHEVENGNGHLQALLATVKNPETSTRRGKTPTASAAHSRSGTPSKGKETVVSMGISRTTEESHTPKPSTLLPSLSSHKPPPPTGPSHYDERKLLPSSLPSPLPPPPPLEGEGGWSASTPGDVFRFPTTVIGPLASPRSPNSSSSPPSLPRLVPWWWSSTSTFTSSHSSLPDHERRGGKPATPSTPWRDSSTSQCLVRLTSGAENGSSTAHPHHRQANPSSFQSSGVKVDVREVWMKKRGGKSLSFKASLPFSFSMASAPSFNSFPPEDEEFFTTMPLSPTLSYNTAVAPSFPSYSPKSKMEAPSHTHYPNRGG